MFQKTVTLSDIHFLVLHKRSESIAENKKEKTVHKHKLLSLFFETANTNFCSDKDMGINMFLRRIHLTFSLLLPAKLYLALARYKEFKMGL
jgi:hypothetical protein